MKRLLFLCFILVITSAKKEEPDELDKYLSNSGIWRYIEKRLGVSPNEKGSDDEEPKTRIPPVLTATSTQTAAKANKLDEHNYVKSDDQPNYVKVQPSLSRVDSLGNRCLYNSSDNLIIRSKASLSSGAFYLKSFSEVTGEQCAEYCCYTQGCNLAVFENKDENNCYLFNCGSPSKCLYASHSNYTTMAFPTHGLPSVSESKGQQKTHENELHGLNKPTTKQPTTTAPTPPPRHTVPLFGKCYIDWNDKCADPNSHCLDDQCRCVEGYKPKFGFCRKICEHDMFECNNKGQSGNVPDCIDRELVCDGTSQCADESDEQSCPVNTGANTKPLTDLKGQGEETKLDRGQNIIPPNRMSSKPQVNPDMSETPYMVNPGGKTVYGAPQRTELYNTMQRPVNSIGYGQPVASDNVGMLNSNPQYQNYYWPHGASEPSLSNDGYRRPVYNSFNGLSPYDQYQQQPGLYSNQESAMYNGGFNDNGMQNGKPIIQPNLHMAANENGRMNVLGNGKGSYQNKFYPKDGSNMYPSYNIGRKSNADGLMGNQRNGVAQNIPQGYDLNNDESKQDVMKSSKTTTVKTTTTTTTTTQPTTTTKTTTTTTTTTTVTPPVVTAAIKADDMDYDEDNSGYFPTWGRNNFDKDRNHDQGSSVHGKNRNRQKQFHKSQKLQEQQHIQSSDLKLQDKPVPNTGDSKQKMPNDRNQVHKMKGGHSMNRVYSQKRPRIKAQKDRYPLYDELGYGGRRYPYKWTDYNGDYYYPDYSDQSVQVDRPYHHYDFGVYNKGDKVKEELPKKTETDSKDGDQPSKEEPKKEQQSSKFTDSQRPGPPQNVRINTKTSNKVIVEWDPSEASPCCPVMAYSVDIQKTNGYKSKVNNFVIQADTLKKVLDNLEPDTNYTISIRAYSIKSGASFRSRITVLTDGNGNQANTETKKNSSVSRTTTTQVITASPTTMIPTVSTPKPTSKPKHSNSSNIKKGSNTVIVEEEVDKVVVESPTDSNEGPIVALALGLGITLMLLVFVGCRLRTVKRRIRKGRALHSNEADYLINGMYL